MKGTLLVAVTGRDQKEHWRRNREAEFDHHLVKRASAQIVQQVLATLK